MEEIMELMVEEINYVRITIPPGVYTSFKGVSEVDSLIANCATLPHDVIVWIHLPAKFLTNGMIKSEKFYGVSQSQYYHELFEWGAIS